MLTKFVAVRINYLDGTVSEVVKLKNPYGNAVNKL